MVLFATIVELAQEEIWATTTTVFCKPANNADVTRWDGKRFFAG